MVSWLILLLTFSINLTTEVMFVGQTVNTEGKIVYWDVYYSGLDSSKNMHRIKETVTLRDPPYNGLRARLVALDQLVKKIEAEDEQTLGFIRAIESGQYEKNLNY